MENYFNTTNLNGKELEGEKANATSQQEFILSLFYGKKDEYTASEMWKAYLSCGKRCPITSVRRALTNLTSDGKLEKTNVQRIGIYGKPEYVYQLVEVTNTVTVEQDGQLAMF